MKNNIKNKTIKGVKWTSINTIFTSVITPLHQIILAILLVPEEFAYIAVITLFIGLSNLFSDVGVGEAVIQRDNINSRQLSSLFYFNIFIVILVSFGLFILAPFIKTFDDLDNLDIIIRIIIISILANGTTSLFKVYLQKKLLLNLLLLQTLFSPNKLVI